MILRTTFFALLLSVSAGWAEKALRPAELPPASYAGQQYVDSNGCLFLRTGTGAETVWIPRVSRDGASVCGYPPSGRRVPVRGETVGETGSGS